MSLHRYVAGRLAQSLFLILLVISLGFFVMRLAPGDPVLYLYGAQNVSAETLDAMRRQWGLDRPLWQQYTAYVGNLLQGNLGYSQLNQQPVARMLARIIPNTLLLMIPSLVLATTIGVLLGILAARRLNSWGDYLVGAVSMVGYSTPPFWLGIVFIVVFASGLRWLPTQGMSTLGSSAQGLARALDVATHMVLPLGVLVWWYLAAFARLTRASMLEESRKPYLMTARMKGLSEAHVIFRHAFRNASRPILTILGLHLGTMFAGTVMTEVVFAWPGMGRLTFNAIIQHDYPVVLGVFVVTGVAVVMANLLIDLLYVLLDPRIRYG
ncbi:MAG TPA: ABC transporter permease [Methylomirabilota bacterium]|jgi:peptide/nickel transport system permease protein|nr:ABC transporter permease [Methylomirabilota bacterium]